MFKLISSSFLLTKSFNNKTFPVFAGDCFNLIQYKGMFFTAFSWSCQEKFQILFKNPSECNLVPSYSLFTLKHGHFHLPISKMFTAFRNSSHKLSGSPYNNKFSKVWCQYQTFGGKFKNYFIMNIMNWSVDSFYLSCNYF